MWHLSFNFPKCVSSVHSAVAIDANNEHTWRGNRIHMARSRDFLCDWIIHTLHKIPMCSAQCGRFLATNENFEEKSKKISVVKSHDPFQKCIHLYIYCIMAKCVHTNCSIWMRRTIAQRHQNQWRQTSSAHVAVAVPHKMCHTRLFVFDMHFTILHVHSLVSETWIQGTQTEGKRERFATIGYTWCAFGKVDTNS